MTTPDQPKNTETSTTEAIFARLRGILTTQETEILRLYFEGFSTKEIAQKLGIRPSRIHLDLYRARRKIQASDILNEIQEGKGWLDAETSAKSPPRLIKGYTVELLSSLVGALITTILSVILTAGGTLSLLSRIPSIYLNLGLVAAILLLVFITSLVIYEQQKRRQRNIIAELKRVEEGLFSELEHDIPELLGERVLE